MAETDNPFGGASTGSTAGAPPTGMFGQQTPWSAYGGFQSPYGGFSGAMQSPYGGYPMQSPYGGYPMQSPYGGQMYGGYGMSPYAMQQPYGAPQQQSMMAAPQQQSMMAAPQQAAAAPMATPQGTDARDLFDFNIGGNTSQSTKFEPWTPLGNRYEGLWAGKWVDPENHALGRVFTGTEEELSRQQELGPLGFDPSSEAGLKRMEQLAGGANPTVGSALNATRDIASGDQRINTGGMFGDMYDNPGITGQQQYQDMARRDAIGNASQYNQLYGGMQGQGSLYGGRYGQVASGELMGANPYREKAIQDAMNQTSDQVKATMSSRGRFGSDAYGDAMGRALGQVATQARMQGYDTDTANMMAAAQGRSGEALARGGLGLQAAQGLSGIQGQNYQGRLSALSGMNQAQQMAAQQRLAAAQGLTGVQGQNLQNRLQAAGMAPAMQNLRYDDAQRMLQAGAAREAMAQQQRNFGWEQLGQYRSSLGNLPGAAGQQTQEASQPWWQQALGIGAGIAGIYGGMGGGG